MDMDVHSVHLMEKVSQGNDQPRPVYDEDFGDCRRMSVESSIRFCLGAAWRCVRRRVCQHS